MHGRNWALGISTFGKQPSKESTEKYIYDQPVFELVRELNWRMIELDIYAIGEGIHRNFTVTDTEIVAMRQVLWCQRKIVVTSAVTILSIDPVRVYQ